MKPLMNPEASATIVDDLRFLRYRREVVSQMPAGHEREERLHAINSRMHRLERETLSHAA